MKKTITMIIAMVMTSLAYSQELSNIQSAFLDVGFGAKPMAMGGAYTAIAKNANSIIWNPAAATQSTNSNSFCFDNVNMQDLYQYSYFGYSHKSKKGNALGLGIIYSGDDVMSETSVILSLGLSKKYLKEYTKLAFFDFGINGKILVSSFGNNKDGEYIDDQGLNHQVTGNATGFAVDVAMHMQLNDLDHVAIALKNPLSTINWSSENEVGTAEGSYNEGLPSTLTLGIGRAAEEYSIAIDLDKATHSDTEDVFKLGAEYLFFDKLIAFRSGYSQELLTGENKKYSVGTGFNINIWNNSKLMLDIAYQIETNWEKHNTLRLSCDLLM
jgi:hypothetical protein